jgi:phage baseplate assembly protein W
VAEDRGLLTDIRLDLLHHELRPVYEVATRRGRVPGGPAGPALADFAVISGRDNLGQAVVLRLLTPRGELAALGHPDYGSRLHELIGRPNTETTRNLVRLFILESLAREPRIAPQGVTVAVEPVPGTRDRVAVRLAVTPVGGGPAIDLGPFTLLL